MRRIPFRESFDVVLNLFTSFWFFETDRENEIVLAEVSRVLKPGGLFLLDYENKFSFVVNDVISKQNFVHEMPDGTRFICQNDYDVFEEREILRVQRLTGSRIEESGYSIRPYSLPELKSMLGRHGMEIVQCWGDFARGSYSVSSPRVISLWEEGTVL